MLTLIVRWLARLGSLAMIGLLAAMAFDEFGHPTILEWIGLALFPGTVVLGMALGWWREGIGGLMTAGGLLCFYLYQLMVRGELPGGPYFVLFGSPGLVFGLLWAWERAHRPMAARS